MNSINSVSAAVMKTHTLKWTFLRQMHVWSKLSSSNLCTPNKNGSSPHNDLTASVRKWHQGMNDKNKFRHFDFQNEFMVKTVMFQDATTCQWQLEEQWVKSFPTLMSLCSKMIWSSNSVCKWSFSAQWHCFISKRLPKCRSWETSWTQTSWFCYTWNDFMVSKVETVALEGAVKQIGQTQDWIGKVLQLRCPFG